MESLRIETTPKKEAVTIFVDGIPLTAFCGETVFAALTTAGYRTLRKSRKIGEARGGFCGMGVCYECRVTIDGVQNRRSCMCRVADGMEITLDAL